MSNKEVQSPVEIRSKVAKKVKEGRFLQNILLWMFATVVVIIITVANLLPRKGKIVQTVEERTNKTSPKSIVWYTRPELTPTKEQLTCNHGSRSFTCNVYGPEFAPESPGAYIFVGMDIDRLPLPRENKTIWALFHEESPRNTPIFMHEKALNLFNFSSTFNRNSDVPIPLYHLESLDAVTTTRYFVNTSIKNSILNEISPIVFFQSNCYTFTGRDEYVRTLMKYIRVDSYGLCLHNKDIDLPTLSKNPLVDDELMNVLAKYKFMIAIENAACIDYVTEKFWRAIELGVVPIYYGSPLIRDWLPNNTSAILLEDFPTPKMLSQYLRYLLQNNSAYEEYLEHKTLGIISNRKLIDEISAREYDKTLYTIKRRFLCFICERLHDTEHARANIVTKKHYECLPPSPLVKDEKSNVWEKIIKDVEESVNQLYREIKDPNSKRRASNTTWSWSYAIPIQ